MYCKVLRLSTGDTIIASITEEASSYIDVFRPIKVAIASKTDNTFNVMLLKWDPTTNFSLPMRIFKTGIVSVGEPNDEFLNSYMEIYNEYEQKTDDVEDKITKMETVDDLSDELERLLDLMKASSNTVTLH